MPTSSANTNVHHSHRSRRLLAALLLPIAVTACASTTTSVIPKEPTQSAPDAAPPATEPGNNSGKDAGGSGIVENPAPPTTPTPATVAADELRDLLGLAEKQAEAHARERGLTWRVVSRNGQDYPVTMDYSPERVNATITNGIVTRVTIG